jgi:hypothetical protein
MNTVKLIFTIAILSCTTFVFGQEGQLFFSLQQISDITWGVFVKPGDAISPSAKTAAGSGQVTIVAPIDFQYANLEEFGGSWVENARVNGPQEATDKSYISFGFVNDNPRIQLIPNEETLLFTFTTDAVFNGSFQLFDNQNDPFNTPNSYETNPGNDLGMLDFGTGNGMQTYQYSGNYQLPSKAALAVFVSDDEGK